MDKLLSDCRVKLSRHIPSNIMRAVHPFITVQFLTFMLMGIINTAVSVTVAMLLDYTHTHFLSPNDAFRIFTEQTNLNFITGYVISIVTSFFLNSIYTFHQKPTLRRFIRFPISYIPNFLFQYIFVSTFTMLGLYRPAAYICAAVIGTPVTYAAMKLFVYKRKK